jgi:hypothetical protein
VLLLVSTPAHYNHLINVANALLFGDYVPVFYVEKGCSDYSEIIKRIISKGFFFTDGQNVFSSKDFLQKPIKSEINVQINSYRNKGKKKYFSSVLRMLKLRLESFFITSIFVSVKRLILNLIYIKESASLANKIFKNISPAFLFVCEDNGYASPYFVAIAKKKKIMSINLPFSMVNMEEYIFSYNLNKYDKYSCLSKLSFINIKITKLFFPTWVCRYNGKDYAKSESFLIPFYSFLSSSFVQNPWTITGGQSDLVYVESNFVKDYYVNTGTSIDKIEVIGSFSYNSSSIVHLNKHQFANEIGANLNDIWVVVSPSPDHLANEIYSDFETMLTNLIGLLTKNNVTVIISIHPRLKKSNLNFLLKKYKKLILIEGEVEKLISFCDLFIASGSASIRYALAFKKPIINFNIYKLPYSEYDHLPMVKKCENEFLFKYFYQDLIMKIENNILNDLGYEKYPSYYFGCERLSLIDKLNNI